MSTTQILFAFGLTLTNLGIMVAVAMGCRVRLRSLTRRIQALENRAASGSASPSGPALGSAESPLTGVRVALAIVQDHAYPVFATFLREILLREEAFIDEGGELRIEGEIVGNGYADVYFRAELSARLGVETLFVLAERPPHGDRPENLAREFVDRLRKELEKRERQGALRELHPPR